MGRQGNKTGRSEPKFVMIYEWMMKTEAWATIDASDYVGWTIVYSGTVTGYIDENGAEQDDFEGCEHGRQLIFDYTKAVTCAEYSYSNAYRPDILVISDGTSMKACINSDMYDIRR